MLFNKFFLGQTRAKREQKGFDGFSNADVHSKLGQLQCQLALTVEDASTINEPCYNAQDNSGNTYFFSKSSGKTWKRTTAGAYSLVNTNANGAHKYAAYFDGAIYYGASTKIGKFDLSSTWNDSFATASSDSDNPMHEVNLGLFIGAGAFLDKVDSGGTYSTNVLDLPEGYVITALTDDGNGNLLIGTRRSTSLSHCKVFLWDTFSDSWLLEDEIEGSQVNAFINVDNQIFAQIGSDGRIYEWTGAKMAEVAQIRDAVTTGTQQKAIVYNGKALIVGGESGEKIYSFHRKDNSMPRALVHEFTATNTITSLAVQGTTLLASYS